MEEQTTLNGAFISGVSAAELALAMRRRMAAFPAPPAPGADRLFAALLTAAILLAAVFTGGVVYALRPQQAPAARTALVRIGDEWLAPPLALMGPAPEEVHHEVGLLRLRLAWPSLGPAQGTADVHVTIAAADPQFDPTDQLKTWSRFLSPTAWSNPGGLMARNFRKATPFENDELYLALPDGKTFAALCPQTRPTPIPGGASTQIEEPCRATLRHGAFDISLRFPREALTDWEKLTNGVRGLVTSLRR